MSRSRWLENFSRNFGSAASRRRRTFPRPAAAACERLEDRSLLTTFVVNSLVDAPPAVDGLVTLREALTAANTNAASGDAAAGSADGDTISFSVGGVITLTQGQLAILDDVSIVGGGNVTVNGAGLSRVFFVDTGGGAGSAFDVALSRLTVTGGSTAGGTGDLRGGGIHVTAGDAVTLTAVTVTGNAATAGGGIFNAGSLITIAGTVSNNAATVEGGGLWNDAAGTAIVSETAVTGNAANGTAADDGGGGLFNNGGTLRVRDAVVSNNTALGALGSGGGIFSAAGNLTVFRTTVSGNTAERAGGGIEIVTGRAILDQSLIESNTTGGAAAGPGNGGGLHVTGTGAFTTVYKTRIRLNAADSEGGGLWNAAGSRMDLDQAIVEDNTAAGAAADDGGGGIFNNGGTLLLSTSVVNVNDATGALGSGGGIFSTAGNVTVYRSLIGGNTAQRAGGGVEIVTGRLIFDQSLIESNTTGGAAAGPGNGGGLHVTGTGAETIVYKSTVRLNTADLEGGGLWNATGSRLVVDQSTVADNVAAGAAADDGGGGIFNNGGSLLVAQSVVTGNDATGALGSGGGIFSTAGDVIAYLSLIGGNSAARAGGGVEIVVGSFVSDRSRLDGNEATGAGAAPGNGGGLHTTGAGASAYIFLSEVRNNVAGLEGGGLWNAVGSRLTVDRSTISGNFAAGTAADDGGGGIFDNGGTLVVNGSFVTDNDASGAAGRGGGVFLVAGGTVDIVRSVIARNDAIGVGGGVFNDTDADLSLTQISDNRAADGGGVFTDAGATSDLDLDRVFANFPNNLSGPGTVV